MRKMNPEKQASVNFYFFKIVKDIGNEIIDLALDECYKKYNHYPNFQAIHKVRNILNNL